MAWTIRQMGDFGRLAGMGTAQPRWYPLNPCSVWGHSGPHAAVSMLTSRRMSARPFGPRLVANRAHRRTISAAPQEVSQSRPNYKAGCWHGVFGEHVRSFPNIFGLTGGDCGEGRATVSLGRAPTAPRLAALVHSGSRAVPGHRRPIHVPSQGERNRARLAMNEKERHEIEALLPWHAAGTLSRRDADRVEQALADDPELARRYDLVRQELAETIHLNETLGVPSARAMEKLFATIDAEEAGAPRRRRKRISRPLSLGTAST